MLAAALTVDVSISTLVAIVVRVCVLCACVVFAKDRDTKEERFSATLVLEEFRNSFYNIFLKTKRMHVPVDLESTYM